MKVLLTRKRKIVLGLLGFLFVFTFAMRLSFDAIFDAILDMELRERLPIRNGSTAFKYWVLPPVPVAFRIFVFDIVNPDEVLAGTEVPTVIERGPYIYRMHLHKTDIQFHDNHTVSFRQPEKFVYDKEASVGSENDTFTTLNIPFLTTANTLKYESPFIQTFTDAFYRSMNETTFMNKSVYDIWWGYKDPVLEIGAEILHKFNISSTVLNGKFGFYMDRNNTDDGHFNVYSGDNYDFSNYNMIDRWDGLRHQSSWNNAYANRIKGSPDGSMQPPKLTENSKLTVFDSNMRRTLRLVFNHSTTVYGIDGLNFRVPYEEFASGKDVPEMNGFCTPDVEHCLRSGAINMSHLYYGSPVCVSLPHFVGGDPYYQQQVKGLKPDAEKHQPFYNYHPLTGVALTGSRRYQINLMTRPYKYFEAFQKLPEAYIPILWIDGVADMDSDTIHMFKNELQNMMDAMVYVKAALIGLICLYVVIIGLVVYCWWRKDKKSLDEERSPLLRNGGVNHMPPQTNGSVPTGTYTHIQDPHTDPI
ncbi:scavenger receptor class B member 1 [Elysia marginata]|uniref:Scavenger receptor class B member 1 n=1 Tax=Elysia marginata TaxID=1093978 RepID=A0AAV4HY24_9GAST|nr:scavenger receptor class B member 1 [Elysia marginata]